MSKRRNGQIIEIDEEVIARIEEWEFSEDELKKLPIAKTVTISGRVVSWGMSILSKAVKYINRFRD